VIPWSIRRYAEHAPGRAEGGPFRKPTALAAQLIREHQARAGVKVMVLFDAYSLGRTVVNACRAKHLHFAATLKSHRGLRKHSWQLKAGRNGGNRLRRRRTATLALVKPHREGRYRDLDAGWLQMRKPRGLRVVCSRQGAARRLLGRVTDDPAVSAAGRIQAYARRWESHPSLKDCKQLLGLGHYQNRLYQAAVIHRPRVCCASACLPHLHIARLGAQGHRTRDKAAHLSTAAAQDQLRGLLWKDVVT
jgi:hypothetical protein